MAAAGSSSANERWPLTSTDGGIERERERESVVQWHHFFFSFFWVAPLKMIFHKKAFFSRVTEQLRRESPTWTPRRRFTAVHRSEVF